MAPQHRAILVGLAFTIPFWLAVFGLVRAIVAAWWPPLPEDEWEQLVGSFFLAISVLGIVGAVVVALPLFKKDSGGKRTFYLSNAALAIVLLLFFGMASIASLNWMH